MLVLSRKTGERLLIGNNVTLTITHIGPNAVKIGIEAPDWMSVVRGEINVGAADLESRHADDLGQRGEGT